MTIYEMKRKGPTYKVLIFSDGSKYMFKHKRGGERRPPFNKSRECTRRLKQNA